ncbi:MAG TPA: DUF3857 domain-containing protein [Pyrinomonadaceae bacterium]|jgi:hypothetical protein|nr:DUF3857 domain-containing protein [Pyrinomonadaceae bacterium]
MESPRSSARTGALFALAVCLLALAFVPAASARSGGDKDWKPVDPAQLAMTTPVVERDADAEVLFWEVHVTYEDSGGDPGTVLSHYVRIKIFNDRGRESHSKIDILAPKVRGREVKIKDIAARTIKPDGTVVELKPEDVFERDVIKASGLKVKAKSFAMPGVEPGAVIEYRWREVRGGISPHERFEFSRNIPVQSVEYWIKPYKEELVNSAGRPVGLRVQTFHTGAANFVKEKDGSYSMTQTNVPAFREEPRMPPEYAVRPWMLVYYSADMPTNPDQFWRDYGRKVAVALKPLLKVNDDIRKAATEAVGDAQTPEQKLERLFDFARAKVKRYTDDAAGLTAEQLKKVKENKSPADTLKRGLGTGADIDLLFGALASAAGFDVRVACTSDRGDIFFDKSFPNDYFIDPASVAVRIGDEWRLFNPGSTYVTFGMLRWQEEGQPTLVADEREPFWMNSPVSPPEKSLEKRIAILKLSDDGTLEGDVRVEYTGHVAADAKELNNDQSAVQREETLREKFKEQLGAVEITDVKVENVNGPSKPFAYAFHVRVPSYAQRTGKRLFLQPAFFQHGTAPMFPTSGRSYDVYFHYPWAEEDHVEVTLPEGFALDNPESPAPFSGGEISKYEPKAMITKDGRTLIYERKFFFGKGGTQGLLFPTTIYASLKAYFDAVNKEDNHTIALKQGAQAASSSKTSN